LIIINPSSINLKSLPWLPLTEKAAFPKQSAIALCYRNFTVTAVNNLLKDKLIELGYMINLSTLTPEHPPIQYFIDLIRNLPDGLMLSHGLDIPFDDTILGFSELRFIYRAKADWLAYYFGDASLIDELTYTDKAFYKFEAEKSKALIEIIQEAFLLSPELQHDYKNLGILWGLIESECFENLLKNSGIGAPPTPTPKHKRYSDIIEACKYLEDCSNLEKTSNDTTSPMQWFCSHCLEICSVPENVLFRVKWNNFLRTLRRAERNIERSALKTAYVENGVIKFLRVNSKKQL